MKPGRQAQAWIAGTVTFLARGATVIVLGVAVFGAITLWQQMFLPPAGTLERSFGRLGLAIVAGVTVGTVAGVLLTHRLRHRVTPLGTRVLQGGILCLPMFCMWLGSLFDL